MKTKATLCWITMLLSLATGATAQTLTVLANFDGDNGANPQAGLIASGGTLYGTTYAGGASNFGTVFAIGTNGGALTDLYSFNGTVYSSVTSNYITTDGAFPAGGLVLSGTMLYGTTYAGGTAGVGTVFTVATNGNNYAVLYNFIGGAGGANPDAGLVLSGNTLYGTTSGGGTAGQGSVFRINTDGTSFTNIYNFKGGTNGANPEAGLIVSGNTLYGTTYAGGRSGDGTVFSVNTSGGSFNTLYSFSGGTDGANPEAGLLLSGATLYGTAANGGGFFGAVFAVNTNGTGFTSFPFNGANGANPQAGLVLSGNTLLGTAVNGGGPGWGAVFQVGTGGGSFTSVYAFTDGSDGANPEASLLLLGGALYGTTQADDDYGFGTVFALPAPAGSIPLSIARQGNQVTLTWTNPANATFSLQYTTNLTGAYSNVSGATSPFSSNTTGTQKYFRLREN